MVKSFRYLFQFAWINLAAILGFAVVVTLGCQVTGVPHGAENLFRTYFGTFPIMTLLMLFIFGFALCSSNLNVALSFGARRRDFFWGVQGVLLVYAGVSWGLQLLMAAVPDLLGWASVDRWSMLLSLGGLPPWLYPLLCLTLLAVGCVSGLLFVRSKALGTILIVVAVIVCMVAAMLAILVGDDAKGIWGQLPMFLVAGMAVVLVVCQGIMWRTVRRFVVR